ncbi:hypothetical protein [Deminuibacter soli]|nr:hypothetical protein [Deminuibacter soli]
MRNRVTAVCIIALLAASCGSSKKSTGSDDSEKKFEDVIAEQPPVSVTRTTTPVTVDGDISEWNVPAALTDHSTGITTTLQADTANLYIAIHVMNQATQYKILRNGLDLYLDTASKKKEQVVIGFPVADQNMDIPVPAPAAANANTSPKKAMIQKAMMMQTHGLLYFHDGLHLKKNEHGPSVALAEDGNNNLVYEAAVPLKEILGENFRLTGTPISLYVGARIHGFAKKQGDDKSEQSFTGTDEGFGGRGRGRRNPAFGSNYQGGAYNENLAKIHKDVVFWVKANVQ